MAGKHHVQLCVTNLVDMDNTICGPYTFQNIVKVWSFGLVSYIYTQPLCQHYSIVTDSEVTAIVYS